MNKRVIAAVLSAIGLVLATYLTLFKLGYVGTLACGTGQCETVQLSRWATFLGLPVAAWGMGYYALVLVLSLAGLRDAHADSRPLALALLLVTAVGTLFSGWLTYLELEVIHAICRYCVVSALIAVLLLVVTAFDWYELGTGVEEDEVPETAE